MGRKREEAATVGDLEDFAGVVRKSFSDLAESVKGQVLKGPEPKGGDDQSGDKGGDKSGDDKGGDGGSNGEDFVPSWGKVSSWFGSATP